MPFIKRTILITGASSGIGRATARKMLCQGHHVIGVSRNCSQFSSKENFTPLQLNLDKPQQLPEQLVALKKEFTSIDTAIFCAGFGHFASLEEFSFAQIQALISVNFTSQVFLAKTLIPGLKRKNSGDLIFVGSEAAIKGGRKGSVYCASKFALRGFAQALREECARSKVRVSIINPGMVKTPFFDQLDFAPGTDDSNYIEAEDVAEAISFIVHANPSIVIDEINLSPLNKVVNFKKNI